MAAIATVAFPAAACGGAATAGFDTAPPRAVAMSALPISSAVWNRSPGSFASALRKKPDHAARCGAVTSMGVGSSVSTAVSRANSFSAWNGICCVSIS